jgi:hypothetical protein
MKTCVIEKNISPLFIKFKIEDYIKNEDCLFIWEDALSKNVKYIDQVQVSSNVEYYSTINKNIDFFENGITFKIIKLSEYKEIFKFEFKNLSFIQGKNVLYISQNSYTGYSYAARNYVYQLINCGFNVSWDTRFTDKHNYITSNCYEKTIFDCLNKKLHAIDSVIIHHTPESWLTIYKQFSKDIKVYGLTTWETTGIHKDWVNFINNSVDEVIVPSRFNIESFKNSGVNKKINLWYHDIFPFTKVNLNIETFFKKCCIYKNQKFIEDSTLIKSIIDSKTVYYNISQFINRKNLTQIINSFCKKFDVGDNVCLFIKTHLENFSLKETNTLKYKIYEILKNYNSPPNIICCFENLNNDEVNLIHEFGDVYFTLNRGEGFGLSTYAAKKIGNRIICGKFGAEKEFLDDSDLLLDYDLGSTNYLDDFNKFYLDERQKCAFYDTDYVVSKLKYFPKVNKHLYNYTK